MRLNSVIGHNFGTYRDFRFDLSSGDSAFIGGENRDTHTIDSNGSGKSLLIDAIVWCPFDMTVRGFSKDTVIGLFDDHTFVTEEWLDDDERIIEITRYRNHPTFKNEVVLKIDGTDSSKITTIKDLGTNEQIVKVLGIDGISFLHSIAFSKSRQSICDAKENERRKLLGHILNTGRVDYGLKNARKDRKALEKQIHQLELLYETTRTEYIGTKKRIEDIDQTIRDEERQNSMQGRLRARAYKKYKMRRGTIKVQIKYKNIETLRYRRIIKEYDSVSARLESLESKASSLRSKYNEVNDKFEAATDLLKASERTLNDYKKKVDTKCPACKQRIPFEHLKDSIKRFEKIRRDLVSDLKDLEPRRQRLIEKYNKVAVQIERAESKIDRNIKSDYRYCEHEVGRLHEELEAPFEFNESKSNIEALHYKRSALKKAKKLLKMKRNEIKQKLDKTRVQFSIAEFWVDGFGNKGIKTYIINGVLDFLQERANEYLRHLTDGYITMAFESEKQLKTSERVVDKLLLNVKTGKRPFKPYHICSRGEQARVWLAMELALNNIIRSRIDLALVDEAFDGIDPTGINRVMKLLANESDKHQIICISHNDNVKKLFHKKYTVIMEKDESRLVAA